jgi:hypothetical protein
LSNLTILPDKQTTLDLFTISIEKMKQEINKETDKKVLGQLNRKASVCHDLIKTRLHNLRFE